MNMTVARKLHERRFRPNPVMTTGELLNLIGSEGMQEALNNRWIVPDLDSGFLTINLHGGKLLELESACCCSCGKTDCACVAADIPSTTSMPVSMREAFTGFGLPAPSNTTPTQAPVMPRTPAMTPTSQNQSQVTPKIGDEATVSENNEEFTGKVTGFEEGGLVRLSFTGKRPTKDRAYGPYELRVNDAA